MDSYLTLKAGCEAVGELVDRKSRFIAQLAHVESEREADAFIAEVRSRHHDARHNVPAWVLDDGRERASDDGEPQRTSGIPSLEVLRGAGLKDVCVVTTRYFGGTLLGPGGLVRAYSGAVQNAVDEAVAAGLVVEKRLVVKAVVSVPYAWYERVRRMAEDAGGKVSDQLFTEDVTLTLLFKAGDEAPFSAAVTELANGEELVRCGEPFFGEF